MRFRVADLLRSGSDRFVNPAALGRIFRAAAHSNDHFYGSGVRRSTWSRTSEYRLASTIAWAFMALLSSEYNQVIIAVVSLRRGREKWTTW